MDTGELNVKIDNGIIQKANQDKNGNDIPSTYATKNELNKASLWKVENGVLKPKDLNEITLDDLASETQYVSEIVKAIMDDNFLPIDGTAKKALSDGNGNNIADTYFPKSGGALSGSIIKRNIDDGTLKLFGGSDYTKGGYIVCVGKDNLELDGARNKAGMVTINAVNGKTANNEAYLSLFNDGHLSFGTKDLGASAIVAKSLGTNGYVKCASGLIVQWGRCKTNSDGSYNSPFNVSFSTVCSMVCSGMSAFARVSFIANTGYSIYAGSANIEVMWYAIGY